MSFTDHKLTDEKVQSLGVVSAPDIMAGTAEENKAVFDRLVREYVTACVNGLIGALMDPAAASELGFRTPEGMKAKTLQQATEELLEKLKEKMNKSPAEEGDIASFVEDGSVVSAGMKIEDIRQAVGTANKAIEEAEKALEFAERKEVLIFEYGGDALGIVDALSRGAACFCRKTMEGEIGEDYRYYPLVAEKTEGERPWYVFEEAGERVLYSPCDIWSEGEPVWKKEKASGDFAVVVYGDENTNISQALGAGKVVVCRRDYVDDGNAKSDYYLLSNVDDENADQIYTFTNGSGWAQFNLFADEQWACGEYERAVSPTVEVDAIEGGHRITITDAEGEKTADIMDGHTPVRGTDYWTPADKAEIKSYVDDAILGGAW